MLNDDFKVLESVVHITAERNIKSLEKVLLETLAGIKTFDSLILLRITTDAKHEYLDVARSIPEMAFLNKLELIKHDAGEALVRRDGSINRCISNNEINKTSLVDITRVIFPITVNKKIIAVLDVYDHQFNAETEKLIKSFIRIYTNFLAILHDNEHDTLTGLLNRKTFDNRISEILSIKLENKISIFFDKEKRQDSDEKLSHWIGILDIDYFKNINDNFGHIYGDEVLILFADLMRKVFRSNDLQFRFGGEEFIVVLLNSSESDALLAFERFRKELEETAFPQVGQVTVSIGMTIIDTKSHVAGLLDRADKALYYAKDHGRNQVCNYSELLKNGSLSEKIIQDDIELF